MKVVALEGIDGSGKTTLAGKVTDYINNNKIGKAVFIDKKSCDAITEFQKNFMSEIKQTLWKRKKNEPINEIDEESWMYLHLLWYHMVETFVFPKYASYDYIIMDGWFYKFLARNLVNQKNDFDYTLMLFEKLFKGDYIFWLNVDPSICYERKKNEIKPSECGIHKNHCINDMKQSFVEYQSNVNNAYTTLKNYFNMIEIDANDGINDIVKRVINYL